MFLSIFILLQVLVDYSVISSVLGSCQVYVFGMMALAVSMSVFLAYNFARVNRDLEVQLDNVKQLSDRAIEQERIAHRREFERKVIEVENDRKNKELESARQLQLSLLPKEVPKLPGLDIAAFMKTATEVGGDYYDFFMSGNGELMVVLGDATGHGLKAGNLVTATKTLLNILAGTEQLKDILIAANRAIKQMDLHLLTMCLAVVRIRGNTLQYSSAGMPPLLVYRTQTGQCEQHVIRAMPLGAVTHFPKWFTQNRWEVNVQFKAANLFSLEVPESLSEYEHKEFSITISAPEQAAIEMLYHIPTFQGFDEAMRIMEGLMTLRPVLV